MPLGTIKKSVTSTREAIRSHWTSQERRRRREMADLMQLRLFEVLRGGPATRGQQR